MTSFLNKKGNSGQLNQIAFLGNYPPRLCGIATFTHDLCDAVATAAPEADCYVMAVNDCASGYDYPEQVHFELFEKNLGSYRRAADYLNFNNASVLCVQHEFGIFGGPAGSHVLAMLEEVRMPVVTTLHTVLNTPDDIQRQVMIELAQRSDRLVVMAHKGAEILQATYGISADKIDVIPHGIPNVPLQISTEFKEQFGVQNRSVLMTFGLLGPGKGIETVIEALPEIVKAHPDVVYLVLGATHPHLLAREGERYRLSLDRLAEERGVKDHVIFYNRFVSNADLREFIGAADVYITPYPNEAQITSGTLAHVLGAGKVVVSTPYWHAQELLSDDCGVLVPFRNPAAIAKAVNALLSDPVRMEKIQRQAHALGREMIWPAVGARYMETFARAKADRKALPRAAFAGWTLAGRPYDLPPLRLDHLVRMTDETGIFQHAIFNVPNFHEGYCVDDNARAYILSSLLEETGDPDERVGLCRQSSIYLSFLAAAYVPETSRFRNFMSHDRRWLEDSGSEDSHGRALWAVGHGAGLSHNEGHQRLAAQLFTRGLTPVETFTSPRSWAFTLLGLHSYLRRSENDAAINAIRKKLTGKLVALWKANATDIWPWFEPIATYDNARLCEALILSGQWSPDPEALEIGLKSLRWLISIQKTPAGHFRPIGCNGFYARDGDRADFDQQPVEAQAMVSACLEASRATGDHQWVIEAQRAFEWFLGRNDLSLPLYNFSTGGCHDGLHPDSINENQGAESTLAYHLARAELIWAGHLNTAPTPSKS